jgi:putative membrane protein
MKTLIPVFLAATLLTATGCATLPVDATGRVPASDIAGLVMAINEAEIQQGNVALQRASSAEVRAFAQMMVNDHTAAQTNARDAFARGNIMSTDNEAARTVRQNSQQAITNLNSYSGAAFDRAYMQTKVDLHQWVLQTLDNVLVPSARTSAVRQLLTNQRASVSTHLDRARQILQGLPRA